MEQTKTRTDVPALLALAERSAAAVAQALLSGSPDQVETATRELQSAATDLSVALRGLVVGKTTAHGRALQQRVRAVAQNIAIQREACLRRCAAVERSLNSIVPATRAATYAGAVSPYGRSGPSGGAFRVC